MNSFEWEVFKRTGKIDHYLLLRESETKNISPLTEFSEEFFE